MNTKTLQIEEMTTTQACVALKSAAASVDAAFNKTGKIARRIALLFVEQGREVSDMFAATFAALPTTAQSVIVNNLKQIALQGRKDESSLFRRNGESLAYRARKGTIALFWEPLTIAAPAASESAEFAEPTEEAQKAAKLVAGAVAPVKKQLDDMTAKNAKLSYALETARAERNALKSEADALRKKVAALSRELDKMTARAESAERILSAAKVTKAA